MHDPEREHFRQEIRDLRRANRFWKRVATVTTTLAALLLLLAAGVGATMMSRLRIERREAAQAMKEAEIQRDIAEQQRQEAEQARGEAEKLQNRGHRFPSNPNP